MKKQITIFMALAISFFCYGQNVNFADQNFEAYCVQNFDTSGDGIVQVSEINQVTNLNVSNLGINSFEGIEEFIALESFIGDFNPINGVVDLSQLSNLENLTIKVSQLTNIVLPLNSSLKNIDLSLNFLTSINLSTQVNLESLNLEISNILATTFGLTQIDVSNSPNLKTLKLGYNKISTLDLTQNSNLEYLDASVNRDLQTISWGVTYPHLKTVLLNNNSLSGVFPAGKMPTLEVLRIQVNEINSIYLGNNSNLETFTAAANDLTSLSVLSNTNLHTLKLFGNQLTSLSLNDNQNYINVDVRNNNLTSLRAKSNTISIVKAEGNEANLCIEVLDVNAASSGSGAYQGWSKDVSASFNTVCGLTYIPDDDFEQWVINNTNETGPIDDYVETSNINNILSFIHPANINIVDFTGIEDFEMLQDFQINSVLGTHNVSTLNLSQNVELKNLILEKCPHLGLITMPNSLTSKLERVTINRTSLTFLSLYDYNALNHVTLINNYSLSNLTIYYNLKLENLVLINAINLQNYYIGRNNILKDLIIVNSNLNYLDTNDMTLVTSISLYDNKFIHLGFDNCPNRNVVNVEEPNLEAISFANGNNLSISNMNLQNNPNLTCIEVDDPQAATAANTAPYTNWSKPAGASYSSGCLTYVPDDDFENWIVTNTSENGPIDDWVSTSSIDYLTSVSLNNLGIKDLTGIWDFSSMHTLKIKNENDLEVLVLDNPNLNKLSVVNCSDLDLISTWGSNGISNLKDVLFKNIPITSFNSQLISSGFLESLELENLYNLSNPVVVSTNQNLKYLMISKTSVDMQSSFNGIPNVETLYLDNVGITSFDALQFPQLKVLNVTNNPITSLDITSLPNLEKFACTNNNLKSLDLRNGNNSGLVVVKAQNNPDLICIAVDTLNGNFTNWTKDPGASYNVSCEPSIQLDTDFDICDKTCIELTDYIDSVFSVCTNYTVDFYDVSDPQNHILVTNTNFTITKTATFRAIITETCTGLVASGIDDLTITIVNTLVCQNNPPSPCASGNRPSIDVSSIEESLMVYPNPTNGLVNLKTNEFTSGHFTIRNKLGMLYSEGSINKAQEKTVDLTSVSSGLYFLTFYAEGQEPIVQKILKN